MSTINCYVPAGDYWPSTWTGSSSTVIYSGKDRYFYQITCPKCGHKNWCELEKTVTCEGIKSQERQPGGKRILCNAQLKAVSKVVDNPIQVEV